jgi:hypothetical protein
LSTIVCDQLGHLHALSLDINHYHYQPPSTIATTLRVSSE